MAPERKGSAVRLARLLCAAAVALALTTPSATLDARTCWLPPTPAPVVDPFREPACRWCPGNRGIEYGTRTGDVVRAVAAGRVTFSGSVAGVRYVVVQHADGRRTTYGRLAATRFRVGDAVIRGVVVGSVAGRFHFGLREGDTYVDPAPLLGRFVNRPRLVPTDGRAANPPPPPVLRCGAHSVARTARAGSGVVEVAGRNGSGRR